MKKATKEQMIAEVEEVANFYNWNNRAVGNDARCKYITDCGKPCAIGRKLTKEELSKPGINQTPLREIIESGSYWEHFDIRFLVNLQNLHDKLLHWTETGLSETGVLFKESIIRDINKGEYGS